MFISQFAEYQSLLSYFNLKIYKPATIITVYSYFCIHDTNIMNVLYIVSPCNNTVVCILYNEECQSVYSL